MTARRQVFGESCASCHSSKQPPAGIDPHSGEGKEWFRAEVMKPDFLENNFLSNEERYPLSKIETNSARARSGPMPWPATFGIISPRKPTRTFRRSTNSSSTIRLTKRSRSSSARRTRTPARVTTARHHSLVSGVRRPSCTTTRSAFSPAILRWKVASRPSTMPRRSCSGRRSGWARLPSGAPRTNVSPSPERIRPKGAPEPSPIATVT